jgi:hypothetical protein
MASQNYQALDMHKNNVPKSGALKSQKINAVLAREYVVKEYPMPSLIKNKFIIIDEYGYHMFFDASPCKLYSSNSSSIILLYNRCVTVSYVIFGTAST